MLKIEDLVLRAIRLAERAHRTRAKGPHYRKAPPGEDKPYYFVHLAEVAWMLMDAGCSREVIAAGYLHDIIEDCDYTADRLETEIGSSKVRELVEWVSEPGTDPENPPVKIPWEARNNSYLARIKQAPGEALSLSCADKTANLMDMCRWLQKGYDTDDFTSRDYGTQLRKFEALDEVFLRGAAPKVYMRFRQALDLFEAHGT